MMVHQDKDIFVAIKAYSLLYSPQQYNLSPNLLIFRQLRMLLLFFWPGFKNKSYWSVVDDHDFH